VRVSDDVVGAAVDRVEIDLGPVAGVSDRGLVHDDNEDGMGLVVVPHPGGPPRAALVAVVCDGVSSVPESGPAARAAAAAATDAFAEALAASFAAGADVAELPDDGYAGDAVRAAAAAAQEVVAGRAVAAPGAAPSCTFVTAAVVPTAGRDVLAVGSLGDSRVYLFGDSFSDVVTGDDTVAAEAAREGLIPAAAAETAYGAHTITRWLGADSPHVVPRVRCVPLDRPGRVVVCSDGLWNYASAPAALAAHIADLPASAPAIEVARHLTEVALRAGGRDNITVVVIDVPGTT
jgi:PPM family protein phosphatase